MAGANSESGRASQLPSEGHGFGDRQPDRVTHTIALANQKGGVGKTTTTLNLSFALARAGANVLMVDLDPQASLSQGLGVRPEDPDETMFSVLDAGERLEHVILELSAESAERTAHDRGRSASALGRQVEFAGGPDARSQPRGEASGSVREGRVDLAPAHIAMTSLDSRLQDQIGNHAFLSEALDEVRAGYDFILIDCRPALDTLEINALFAAEQLLIPVETYRYSLYATRDLAEFYSTVQKRLKPELRILGVLFTRVEARTRVSRDVRERVSAVFRDEIFETQIRKNVRLGEVAGEGDSIFDFAPTSHGAEDYRDLAKEVMNRVR